ncbi:hypothetical protein [Anaerophaga thermohalophila]|uniref:hypothetical protein n=1 Tax=Anaerophaga thermohalophila TaxID=177400 RepID=UPI001C3FFFBF|nr:hypothetical protein [Anaerophaga thermohalophila]
MTGRRQKLEQGAKGMEQRAEKMVPDHSLISSSAHQLISSSKHGVESLRRKNG